MSTPVPVRDARVEKEPTPLVAPVAEKTPRRALSPRLGLPLLFAVAVVYHLIQAMLHTTPAIFTDELLHSGLAQAFASGNPFEIRGEDVFFPAFLPALWQAPAWLFGDAGTAYVVAKTLNAVAMSAAVFPAYWLARRVVRPSFALLVAAMAVAAPAMLYDAYLLSEALAYPVFLVTFAILVRALETPSPRWGAAAVAVSVVAVGTRVQFVALPLVFALLLVARPKELRRHKTVAIGFGVLALVTLVGGTALLGTYSGLALVDYPASQVVALGRLDRRPASVRGRNRDRPRRGPRTSGTAPHVRAHAPREPSPGSRSASALSSSSRRASSPRPTRTGRSSAT